jgi:hypothetical protein
VNISIALTNNKCLKNKKLLLRYRLCWLLTNFLIYMPVVSMFYGLIISMYYLDTKQHKLPHIHVKYGEIEAVYEIPKGNLLEGLLPGNKEKLLQAWIEIHQEELMANWQLAITGRKLFNIDPLK